MSKNLGLFAAAWLASCTWLVPDREREYLSVRPLPPLKLPAESVSLSLTIQPPAAVPAQPPLPSLTIQAENAPFIELNQPFQTAWVTTLKALNLLRLELTERDPERGILRLVYTSPAVAEELAKDRGWLGDLLYFFTAAETLREQKYQLLLQPSDSTTRLYLLDSEGRPRNDKATLELLERLKQTLATLTQSSA